MDYYFIGEDGDMFKAAVEYRPYFLVCVRRGEGGGGGGVGEEGVGGVGRRGGVGGEGGL